MAAAALASVFPITCNVPPSRSEYVVPSNAKPSWNGDRVVLVTIDGARWQDVFEGTDLRFTKGPRLSPEELLPKTWARVKAAGVAVGTGRDGCGIMHTASGANVSLPGYLEMFTGHASSCTDNDCPAALATVLDAAAAFGVPGVASIASWSILSRGASNGRAGVFVAAGQRWPGLPPDDATLAARVAAGTNVDPFPGHDDYRPDAATGAIALAYFDRYRPALFHVGFGDPDEWGHRGDYDAYVASLARIDAWMGDLLDRLAATRSAGHRTTVLVTTDHGRNADFLNHGPAHPESARTFLLAFDGASDGVLRERPTCPAGDVALTDVAPTVAQLVGIPVDTTEGAGRPMFAADGKPSDGTERWVHRPEIARKATHAP